MISRPRTLSCTFQKVWAPICWMACREAAPRRLFTTTPTFRIETSWLSISLQRPRLTLHHVSTRLPVCYTRIICLKVSCTHHSCFLNCLLDLRGEVSETPKVNGYGFVSSTPTPSMSQMENDPEMLTWGTIEDEPLLISSGVSSTGPSPFKLPPTPRRELIAQKLSEKASKSFRDSSSLRAKVFSSPSTSAVAKYHSAMRGDTPTPHFSAYPYETGSPTPYRKTPGSTFKSERMASPSPRARAAMLSPAAQSLLNRAKSSRSQGADHQLRSSYGSSGRAGSRLGSVTPSPLTSRPK